MNGWRKEPRNEEMGNDTDNPDADCWPRFCEEVGIKYSGTDNCAAFIPEETYGAVFFVEPFKNTEFSVEYLKNEYENNDDEDTVTAQLAYEF